MQKLSSESIWYFILGLLVGIAREVNAQGCNDALGMASGLIKDNQITAKGSFGGFTGPDARYNNTKSWCSITTSFNTGFEDRYYLQIDLLKDFKVTSISLKGDKSHSYGPKIQLRFRTSISASYQPVTDGNGSSVLKTKDLKNENSEKIVFSPPLCTRFLRYIPMINENHKCIRLEIYGCTDCSNQVVSPTTVPPTASATASATTASATIVSSTKVTGSPPDKGKLRMTIIIIIVLVVLLVFVIVAVIVFRCRTRIRRWNNNRKKNYQHPKFDKRKFNKTNKQSEFHVQYEIAYSDEAADTKQAQEHEDSTLMLARKTHENSTNKDPEMVDYSEVYAAPVISESSRNNRNNQSVQQTDFNDSEYAEMDEPLEHLYSPTMNNHKPCAEIDVNPIYEGSQIYENPYRTVTGSILYADPNALGERKNLNVKEFPRNKLKFMEKIGQGQFGEVYICEVDGLSDIIEGEKRFSAINMGLNKVAVKMLKSGTDKSVEEEFMKEARVMSRLEHDNVVQLIGVCYENPKCMVVEYMEKGDLMQFLKGYRRYEGPPKPRFSELPSDVIVNDTLLYIATQIAAGMNYLSSEGFVHRDLATRNCLVGNAFTVKIADFGMSRCLYSKQYYRIEGKAVLPIRWMAPESLYYGTFTSQSDVWAFAVTVWEIFMFVKEQPYDHLSDKQVIDNACIYIQDKSKAFRYLQQPPGCPDDVYSMMLRCWQKSPDTRPEFSDLLEFFKAESSASVEVRI